MDTNKILSANVLDLIFDDRNKEYGAYELRKTYAKRITKALLITVAIALLVFTGAVLANSLKPDKPGRLVSTEVTLIEIPEDEPEPLPEPETRIEPEQVRTEQFTPLVIVDDEQVQEPPPTQEDLQLAQIDVTKQDGVIDEGLVEVKEIDDGKGIIEVKNDDEFEGIVEFVQIPAKYDGNWEKFLTRNLDAEVPVNNGAAVGRYNVIIQFVVDKEGNVSDIKALTNHGYGMEDEAMRVLKKAKDWKPGIQNGREVKSYHKQPITFVVEE